MIVFWYTCLECCDFLVFPSWSDKRWGIWYPLLLWRLFRFSTFLLSLFACLHFGCFFFFFYGDVIRTAMTIRNHFLLVLFFCDLNLAYPLLWTSPFRFVGPIKSWSPFTLPLDLTYVDTVSHFDACMCSSEYDKLLPSCSICSAGHFRS